MRTGLSATRPGALGAIGLSVLLSVACSGASGEVQPPGEAMATATASADATSPGAAGVPAGEAPQESGGATSASASQSADVPTEDAGTEDDAGGAGPSSAEREAYKSYRARECELGIFRLELSRAAYLTGLGGKAPSPARVPSFGLDARSRGGSLESGAHSCKIATAVKGAADVAFDPVARSFYDVALPLSRLMAEAHRYYAEGRHAQDGGQRGVELHACFTTAASCAAQKLAPVANGFAELETRSAPLYLAIDAYVAAHPPVQEAQGTTRRASMQGAKHATSLVRALRTKPYEKQQLVLARAGLEEATKAIRAVAAAATSAQPEDRALTRVAPALDALISATRKLEGKDRAAMSAAELIEVVDLAAAVLREDRRARR